MKRSLLACAAALLVAGCATTTQFARPPEDKLVCADEPGRPVGKGDPYTDSRGVERRAVTDEENGQYLKGLRGAGQSCRDDVNWLRAWFTSLNKG